MADVLHLRLSVSQRVLALTENADLAARFVDPIVDPCDRWLVLNFEPARALAQGGAAVATDREL